MHLVAEKGPWSAVLQHGYDAFQEGDYERALLHYLQAAEMGYELGQSNAAWLLTHVRPRRGTAQICRWSNGTCCQFRPVKGCWHRLQCLSRMFLHAGNHLYGCCSRTRRAHRSAFVVAFTCLAALPR